jgi:two-component system response regulator
LNENIILLVEDNPDDEELTRLALRQCSVPNQTIVVRDGAEALEFLSGVGNFAHVDGYRLPNLILLDLKLPKVSGLEVLEKLRANPRTRLIPVIVLTSSSETNDIISSYRLGANSYVRKPVEYREFADMMNLLGQYWLVHNQIPPIPN